MVITQMVILVLTLQIYSSNYYLVFTVLSKVTYLKYMYMLIYNQALQSIQVELQTKSTRIGI